MKTNKVMYESSDGKKIIYSGGTRTWRNNNPGNLVPGHIASKNNSIGKAGGFAIFPDYESGHAGLLDCLRTTYGNYSLWMMIGKYAPPGENNTARYYNFIKKNTGVLDNKKIKDFSQKEFENLWKTVEKMEGWKEGTITEEKKISLVKKKKGVITSYQIPSFGWVSKEAAIKLAEEGKIDAIVVHPKGRNPYLRGYAYHRLPV